MLSFKPAFSLSSYVCYYTIPGGSDGKASAYNVGDLGSIHGSGRFPVKGNGNPLQYSCLENPVERGSWWATVHGVAKSQTWLKDFTFTLYNVYISLSLTSLSMALSIEPQDFVVAYMKAQDLVSIASPALTSYCSSLKSSSLPALLPGSLHPHLCLGGVGCSFSVFWARSSPGVLTSPSVPSALFTSHLTVLLTLQPPPTLSPPSTLIPLCCFSIVYLCSLFIFLPHPALEHSLHDTETCFVHILISKHLETLLNIYLWNKFKNGKVLLI